LFAFVSRSEKHPVVSADGKPLFEVARGDGGGEMLRNPQCLKSFNFQNPKGIPLPLSAGDAFPVWEGVFFEVARGDGMGKYCPSEWRGIMAMAWCLLEGGFYIVHNNLLYNAQNLKKLFIT
jgi:hypothetical protein